jgi:hypothetical protein
MAKPRLKGEGTFRLLERVKLATLGHYDPKPVWHSDIQNTVVVLVELGLMNWVNPEKPHVAHGVVLTAQGLVKIGQVKVLQAAGIWSRAHNKNANEKWNFLCDPVDPQLVAVAHEAGWALGHDPAQNVREALKFDADHQMYEGSSLDSHGYVPQVSGVMQVAAARRGRKAPAAMLGSSRTNWTG